MRPNRFEGRNRDLPVLVCVPVAAAIAGTGTDFESAMMTVPDLLAVATSGTKGGVPINNIKIKTIALIPAAAITGANTNNFTLNINQWRAGSNIATLGSVTFASGTNAAKLVPVKITPVPLSVRLLPNDVITVQRASIGTGLASPLFTATFSYDPM